jgi:hypothetical protein
MVPLICTKLDLEYLKASPDDLRFFFFFFNKSIIAILMDFRVVIHDHLYLLASVLFLCLLCVLLLDDLRTNSRSMIDLQKARFYF